MTVAAIFTILAQPPDNSAYQSFLNFLAEHRIGDLTGLLGLLIGIVGFAMTLWGVRKTRKAAEAAEDAAHRVRSHLDRVNFVADCSSAITILEEVRRLHRAKAWPVLLDRYSVLKRLLISVRGASNISEENGARLQGAIQHLANMEDRVEKVLAGADDPDVVKLNRIISRQIGALAQVLVEVRSQIGG